MILTRNITKDEAVSPHVSIVLPVRNAAATLAQAIWSIQRQTYTTYEVLAIDDGSTDQSLHMLQQWAAADARVRVLNSGGAGLVAALNAGLEAATTPLIARMDADDLMHPARLALQVAALAAQPDLALIATQAVLFPARVVQGGYREYLRWQNQVLTPADVAAAIYREAPFVHPTVLFRRECVRALGGYRIGAFPEDYDLWLRMHQAGLPMAKLPRVLYAWREHPTRTSRRDPRYAREAFDSLRAHYLASDPRLRGRALVYWGAGRPTRLRARRLISQGFPVQAWIDIDPRKIGQVVWGARVELPEWLAQQRPRPFVLIYVTNHGAQALIEPLLAEWGYRAGADYLWVG
jgi:glycosyltransferase involved in cell wall biosynthesis